MKNNFTKRDKIFIAGASGMAGSSILRALKKKGYGSNENFDNLLIPNRKDLNLLNFNEVNIWFKKNKPDIVIISAAKVGGILANSSHPADFLLENIKIQSNIIESSYLFGVKRLIFLGSSCIYPKYAPQPIKEESLLDGELESTNEWYAIAKIAGIKLCEALRIQKKFDAISLMPTNLYGPGDNYHPTNSHVLPSLIRKFIEANDNSGIVKCWGTGEPLREFMHVDDLGDACLFALEKWDLNCKSAPKDINGDTLSFLNVGTGKDISIKELTSLIAEILEYKGKIIWDKNKPNGTKRKLLDVTKINDLGWKSNINLKEGLKRTILSYKEEISKKTLRSF